jgi:hypothetical protein
VNSSSKEQIKKILGDILFSVIDQIKRRLKLSLSKNEYSIKIIF